MYSQRKRVGSVPRTPRYASINVIVVLSCESSSPNDMESCNKNRKPLQAVRKVGEELCPCPFSHRSASLPYVQPSLAHVYPATPYPHPTAALDTSSPAPSSPLSSSSPPSFCSFPNPSSLPQVYFPSPTRAHFHHNRPEKRTHISTSSPIIIIIHDKYDNAADLFIYSTMPCPCPRSHPSDKPGKRRIVGTSHVEATRSEATVTHPPRASSTVR